MALNQGGGCFVFIFFLKLQSSWDLLEQYEILPFKGDLLTLNQPNNFTVHKMIVK